MNTTAEKPKLQIDKLPKWAQEHIADLQRQRDTAVKALDEYVDAQTPSPFYTDDNECTGEQAGPTNRRRYIQAHAIEVEWRGITLRVSANDYGQSGPGIRLQWSSSDKHDSDIALIPHSHQSVRLVSKKEMS